MFGEFSVMDSVVVRRVLTGTICSVPPSALPRLAQETKEDAKAHGLLAPIVGHVGDGNFHAGFIFRTEEELEAVKAAVDRLAKRAIRLDGTCKSFQSHIFFSDSRSQADNNDVFRYGRTWCRDGET